MPCRSRAIISAARKRACARSNPDSVCRGAWRASERFARKSTRITRNDAQCREKTRSRNSADYFQTIFTYGGKRGNLKRTPHTKRAQCYSKPSAVLRLALNVDLRLSRSEPVASFEKSSQREC